MIAAWASVTAGYAVTHAWFWIALFVILAALAVWLVVIPLTREPTGKRNASRPATPRAGKARAWLRAAPRAVRGLPGAIGWAWRTPVRTTTSLPGSSPAGSGAPGLSAAGGVPRSARPGTQALGPGAGLSTMPVTTATCSGDIVPLKVDSPVPELAHEDRDGTATAAWLRTLRGPGWTILALRRQLAVLGALTSGRVTPGHTAASPHGEPRHPAGDQAPTRGDAQGRAVRVCAPESRPAARADLTGSLSPRPTEERPGLVSAPPDPGTIARLRESPWPQDRSMADFYDPPDPRAAATGSSDGPAPSMPEPPTPVISAAPAFLTAAPPPHDPALWQPRAEQTDWSLLAVIAPDLAAERRDAQTQAGA